MSPRLLFLTVALPALALRAHPAAAQWFPNGVPVCVSCQPDFAHVVPDALGGAYVAWRDGRDYSTTGDDAYSQHVTGAGAVEPGWPALGFPVGVLPRSQVPFSIAVDNLGGVIVAWEDLRNGGTGGTSMDVYAQRIQSNGTLAAGWPISGTAVTRAPDFQSQPVVASDGTGGAFIAWYDWRNYLTSDTDVYAQHLTESGSVSTGWPDGGLSVCTAPSYQNPPSIVADGEGGTVMVWDDGRSGNRNDIYAQRLRPDGTIPPGWVANGLPVVLDRAKPQVAPDDAGGFYVGCSTIDPNTFSDAQYYVQRFQFSGTRSPGWPEGGVRVCVAPSYRDGLKVAPDGTGGLLLAWYDGRPNPSGIQIYAARVLADGSPVPGWAADGVRVSDTTLPGNQFDPSIASDGQGGAYIAWEWEIGTRYIWVQHLTAAGTVAPGWPRYGLRAADTFGQFDPVVVSDGAGGAIVVWEERGGTGGRRGLFAQRYLMDGVVAAQVSLVTAKAEPQAVRLAWHVGGAGSFQATVERRGERNDWQPLGVVAADGTGRIEYEDRSITPGERYAYRLAYDDDGTARYTTEAWIEVPRALTLALEGLRPNPAVAGLNVSFMLPAATSATLALLDVGGRRVIEREVGALGVGRHLLLLADGRQLAPGMYWLRLSQAGETRLARGVVVR